MIIPVNKNTHRIQLLKYFAYQSPCTLHVYLFEYNTVHVFAQHVINFVLIKKIHFLGIGSNNYGMEHSAQCIFAEG